MSLGDRSRLESQALGGLLPIERWLFSRAIRRNVQNDKSRFYIWLPKYGAVGSATLIAANIWPIPGFLFLVLAVVLQLTTNAHSGVRVLSYVFFALCLLSGVLMINGAMRATRLGREHRSRGAPV
jgi:hypothetical protein